MSAGRPEENKFNNNIKSKNGFEGYFSYNVIPDHCCNISEQLRPFSVATILQQ
jgi:hypothetical protein